MKVKTTFVGMVLAVFLLPLIHTGSLVEASAAQKGKGKVVESHAQKSRGGGADENIKSDSDTNSTSSNIPAPPKKGGARSKGAGTCAVFVDNRTGFYIRIYVDGSYRGTLSPWGDAYCYTGSGATKLYAVAIFDDGSRFTWGPNAVNCLDSYTWRLYQ
ncbi:MAG: hypothetical protein AB1757_19195 [Acidobacteriota bacterium]